MLKSLMTNREYQVKNASLAREKLLSYTSIIRFGWWNQTSSAGDWDGYFVQKIKSEYYLIRFSQTNNYPHSGFTLNTGGILAQSNYELPEEEIFEILKENDQY